MTTFYVSGKMRGIPKYNFPQFDSLSSWLREAGDEAINPAQHDREVEPDLETQEHYLKGDPSLSHGSLKFPELIGWDLRMIASPECDAIVMLPGWDTSEGARHERYVAEACQKPVWLANQDPVSRVWYITLDTNQRRLAGVAYDPVTGAGIKRDVTRPRGSQVVFDLNSTRVEGDDIERLEAAAWLNEQKTDEEWANTPPTMPDGTVLYDTDRDGKEVEGSYWGPAPSTVVGLVGYAQVGKDTLAAQLVEKHGFQRIAFADVLRECLYALNPVIMGAYSHPGVRVQELVDREGWDRVKVRYPEVRELLQRLGTEVGREILGNDIWVETALKKIQPGGKYVITDVRFPNEFAAIEKLGGTTVRILREGYGPVNDHWSEKALDSYAADLTVWNADTPENLCTHVAGMLGLTPKTWTKDGVPAPFGGRRALGVEA